MSPCLACPVLEAECFARAGEEEAFQQHRLTQSSYQTMDKLCLLCGAVTNAVVVRGVLLNVLGSKHSLAIYFSILSGILQVAQLALLLARPATYHRLRVQCNLGQRLFRLAAITIAFWHTNDPSDAERFVAYRNMVDHYTNGRSLAAVVALEPLLSLCHALYHHIPFRQQLLYSLARMTVDFTFVVPTLALLVSMPQLDSIARKACTCMSQVLTLGGDMSTLKLTAQTCQDSHRVAYFVPAAMLTSVGTCVPLITGYWLELHTKLQYLRARYPQQAGALPERMHFRALLLLQVQCSRLMCFAFAALAAVMY